MELAKVINKGQHAITLEHAVHGDVIIEPGKERIVSIYHIIINFGNPGARNEGKNRVREADFNALRTRWGFYSGIYPEAAWDGEALFAETGEMVGPFKPQIEVYDLDDNRIWTIIEDPEGKKGTGEFTLTQEAQDSAFVNKRIESLEAQIQQLVGLLASQQTTAAAVPPPQAQEPAGAVTSDQSENPPPSGTGTSDAEPQETQTERNEQRDNVPKPTKAAAGKDKPKTTRVGA